MHDLSRHIELPICICRHTQYWKHITMQHDISTYRYDMWICVMVSNNTIFVAEFFEIRLFHTYNIVCAYTIVDPHTHIYVYIHIYTDTYAHVF